MTTEHDDDCARLSLDGDSLQCTCTGDMPDLFAGVPEPAYRLENGRAIVTRDGVKLVYIDRQIPGELDAILPTEADRFARQIVQALNAAPAVQFDRAQILDLIARDKVETTYDLAGDLADLVPSLLALALQYSA
jgi:hypothetical protein